MTEKRDISKRMYSRRTALKLGGVTAGAVFVGSATAAAGNGKGKSSEFDPSLVNAVNVADASEPTLRIDNANGTAAKVRIHSTGSLDGAVFTVGANQASFDPPEGKYVPATCGEVITDVETRRPQDKTWMPSGFTGTATIGGAGCP